MITDDFLVEKLRDIFNESLFNVNGYKVPKYATKFFNCKTDSIIININEFRNKQLTQRNLYPTTDNFKSALYRNDFLRNLDFIEEFPIVILNRKLWETLNDFDDAKCKSCLFFDFFYPKYNLIVELDGQAFHSSLEPELKFELESKDNSRDFYCKYEFNANIIRLKSFGKCQQPSNDKEIKKLENLIKQLQACNTKPYDSNLYYKYLLKDWKEKHNEELNLINKIDINCKKKIEDNNVKAVNVYLRKENKYKFSENLLYRTKELFSLLYGKTLEILYR
jgi:very-short-patch-repair endonuclease